MKARPDELAVDGLLLRRLTKEDAAPMQTAIRASREHLVRFMPFASADPDHLEFRRQWIDHVAERFDQGSPFNYGIVKNGVVVGGCGIDPKVHGAAAIGYWVHVDHTRRGYASAVARALRDAQSTPASRRCCCAMTRRTSPAR